MNEEPCEYVVMATNAKAYPVVQNILDYHAVHTDDAMYLAFRSQFTPTLGFRVILQPDQADATAGILVSKVSD